MMIFLRTEKHLGMFNIELKISKNVLTPCYKHHKLDQNGYRRKYICTSWAFQPFELLNWTKILHWHYKHPFMFKHGTQWFTLCVANNILSQHSLDWYFHSRKTWMLSFKCTVCTWELWKCRTAHMITMSVNVKHRAYICGLCASLFDTNIRNMYPFISELPSCWSDFLHFF